MRHEKVRNLFSKSSPLSSIRAPTRAFRYYSNNGIVTPVHHRASCPEQIVVFSRYERNSHTDLLGYRLGRLPNNYWRLKAMRYERVQFNNREICASTKRFQSLCHWKFIRMWESSNPVIYSKLLGIMKKFYLSVSLYMRHFYEKVLSMKLFHNVSRSMRFFHNLYMYIYTLKMQIFIFKLVLTLLQLSKNTKKNVTVKKAPLNICFMITSLNLFMMNRWNRNLNIFNF